MKLAVIPLTRGYEALVDSEDYLVLSKYSWYVKLGRGNTQYAYTGIRVNLDGLYSTYTVVGMHNLLLKKEKGQHIDHINGNGLDNRKSNLRTASVSQNLANTRPRKDNQSGYKGVCWSKKEKKWRASISFNKQWNHLGYFSDAVSAAKAYNHAATDYFGEFAWLNKV